MKTAYLLLCVLLCGATSAFGAVWYVDKASPAAPAAQDGQSWSTAFSALQPAIDAASAVSGGDVWVAAGHYNEARSRMMHDPSVETGALSLRQWVRVYGGFLPGDTDLSQRDYAANLTFIDGALAVGGTSPALHVIAGASDATLDGFIVTGGYSPGGTYDGAGLYVDGHHNLTIANCHFENNVTYGDGGGMMLVNAQNTTVSNCTFATNRSFNGGAVLVTEGANNLFQDCAFTANESGWDGAGVYVDRGQTAFIECRFSLNTATHAGGGVFAVNTGTDTVFQQCLFGVNKAQLGGGFFNWTASAHRIVNCVIFKNKTTGEGGGGIFNNDHAVPTIVNCSFSENTAPAGAGGGMANDHESSPVVTNCILWGDLNGEILNLNASTPAVSFSDVEGGYAGDGNITLDPLYEDPTLDNYSLKVSPLSPCIDAGTAAGAPNMDFHNVARPQGSAVDMGAFEAVQHSLLIALSGQGSVDPAAGNHYYYTPASVPVHATALADWHFDYWDGPVASPGSASTTVNVSGMISVTAYFAHDRATLTMAATGAGSVTPEAGVPHMYDTHSVVPVSATAAAGWRFDHWTGLVADPNSANTTTTVDAGMTLTAVFVQQATLTVAIEGGGSVNPAAGSHVYDLGTAVPLAATADDGWHFDHWTGPVLDTANASTSTTVTADSTVTAVFAETSRCGCSGGKSHPFSKENRGDLALVGAAVMFLPMASRKGRGAKRPD